MGYWKEYQIRQQEKEQKERWNKLSAEAAYRRANGEEDITEYDIELEEEFERYMEDESR